MMLVYQTNANGTEERARNKSLMYSQLISTKVPKTQHKERRVSLMGLEKADVSEETKDSKHENCKPTY